MQLTAQQLANAMLKHLGAGSDNKAMAVGTNGSADVTDGMKQSALEVIAGVLEELRETCPEAFSVRMGVVFTPATSGTLTVGDDLKSFTLGTIAAPVNGCSIRINGDSNDNEVSGNAAGTYGLQYQFGGMAGATTATWFGDCVVLGTPAARILGRPVLALSGQPLIVLNRREDFLNYGTRYAVGDYGMRSGRTRRVRWVNIPEAVWLEDWHNPSTDMPEYRLHCTPLPLGTYPVDIEAVTQIPNLTPASLANEDGTDPGVVFGTPSGFDSSILKPMVVKRWMAEPWPRVGEDTRKEIDRLYEAAVDRIENFRANAQAQGRIIIGGT